MRYGAIRVAYVVVTAIQLSSEKAGVGGSIPSLATTIRSIRSLSSCNIHSFSPHYLVSRRMRRRFRLRAMPSIAADRERMCARH